MATEAPTLAPQSAPATAPQPDDSLGIDRAFVIQMARMPLLALLWVAAAQFAPEHVSTTERLLRGKILKPKN